MRTLKVTLVRSRAIDPAINKVAKALSENGYDVKLLVWDRSGNKNTENIDGYTIHRFGFKAPHDKLSIVFYLPIWWSYELFFLLRQKNEIIHVCDLDTLIPAIIAKKLKKTKLYYTIYDFCADNLPNKFPNTLRDFVTFLEIVGIKFSDVLFLVDECRLQQVKKAKIKSLVYIYNTPPDYFKTRLTNYSTTGEELRIFYAGLLHKSRGLEYILRAIRDVNNVKLVVAGTGPNKHLFENSFPDAENKIQYIGQISYKDVIEKTIESDLLFAFYDPTVPNNKYASPNKLFEAMMCGKPILMNSEVAASKIILEEKCGIVVPYGDVDAIKEAINRLKKEPNLRKELGENGRNVYEKKYSWKIMEKRLLNAYKIPD